MLGDLCSLSFLHTYTNIYIYRFSVFGGFEFIVVYTILHGGEVAI